MADRNQKENKAPKKAPSVMEMMTGKRPGLVTKKVTRSDGTKELVTKPVSPSQIPVPVTPPLQSRTNSAQIPYAAVPSVASSSRASAQPDTLALGYDSDSDSSLRVRKESGSPTSVTRRDKKKSFLVITSPTAIGSTPSGRLRAKKEPEPQTSRTNPSHTEARPVTPPNRPVTPENPQPRPASSPSPSPSPNPPPSASPSSPQLPQLPQLPRLQQLQQNRQNRNNELRERDLSFFSSEPDDDSDPFRPDNSNDHRKQKPADENSEPLRRYYIPDRADPTSIPLPTTANKRSRQSDDPTMSAGRDSKRIEVLRANHIRRISSGIPVMTSPPSAPGIPVMSSPSSASGIPVASPPRSNPVGSPQGSRIGSGSGASGSPVRNASSLPIRSSPIAERIRTPPAHGADATAGTPPRAHDAAAASGSPQRSRYAAANPGIPQSAAPPAQDVAANPGIPQSAAQPAQDAAANPGIPQPAAQPAQDAAANPGIAQPAAPRARNAAAAAGIPRPLMTRAQLRTQIQAQLQVLRDMDDLEAENSRLRNRIDHLTTQRDRYRVNYRVMRNNLHAVNNGFHMMNQGMAALGMVAHGLGRVAVGGNAAEDQDNGDEERGEADVDMAEDDDDEKTLFVSDNEDA